MPLIPSVTAGELIDPDIFGNAVLELLQNPPRCNIIKTSTQSIANGGGSTTVTLGTGEVEVVDSHGFKGAADDIITIPTDYAGDYLVTFGAQFAANATGVRSLSVNIGSNTAYPNEAGIILYSAAGHATLSNRLACSKLVRLDEGATLTLQCYQNSGAALDLQGAWLTLHMVAPL